MDMRTTITLIEAISNTPADRFIHAATIAIKQTYGDADDLGHIVFRKSGPDRVQVTDDMQGARTQRSWAILRTLTQLAQRYDVTMNVRGAAGPKFRYRHR